MKGQYHTKGHFYINQSGRADLIPLWGTRTPFGHTYPFGALTADLPVMKNYPLLDTIYPANAT